MQISRIRIGTRGSRLAVIQAQEVRMRLAERLRDATIEIVTIATTGDRLKDRNLTEIGGKGLFTKEIEEALQKGEIDLAVHSMKDMPAMLPEGLMIAGVLPREDPRDAFISLMAGSVDELPKGALVGSSSVRRTAQLKRRRPDLKFTSFRGNVETRLRKLKAGEVQATLLACAGLNRLGLRSEVTAPIEVSEMLPALCQGVIGIETRAEDHDLRTIIAGIDDQATAVAVSCERAFLRELDGSCKTPIAGYAHIREGRLYFRGETLTPDGQQSFGAEGEGSPAEAERVGREAGEDVKRKCGITVP